MTGLIRITDRGRDTVERLRSRAPQRPTPIQLDQACVLVSQLREGWHALAAVASSTGLTEDEVVETVVHLGTWLGQSVNAGSKASTVEFDRAFGDDRTVGNGGTQPTLFPSHGNDCIVVPPGFERRAVGRDLGKAIAQIVLAEPDEALLRRWLMRRYHQIHQVLGFELVALVHRLTQIGRLGEIDELTERNGVFNSELARVLVEAYDLLDVARHDAVEAVDRLVAADPADGGAPLLVDVAQAAWLHEAEFARVRAAAESDSHLRLDTALGELRRAVQIAPVTYRPQGVAQLSDGQVHRLAQREGLRTSGTGRREADEVRSWVVEAGQGPDADLLVADGIRAVRAGLGPEFKKALTRRSNGDLDWSGDLNEALASVARV